MVSYHSEPIFVAPSMPDSHPENSQEFMTTHALDTFPDILRALVGSVVTVANSESYEDAPVGHRLGAGFYKAKVMELKGDHLILGTQFRHSSGHGNDEPVKQFVPLSRIKRVSVMKSEKILHI
jgi:hypothetical protein